MPESDIFRVRPSFTPFALIILGIALFGGVIAFLLITTVNVPILGFIIIAVAVFAILIVVLSWLTTEYALTTERVHIRRGIIGSFHVDIENERISSVEFSQDFLSRILNFGNIMIEGDSPNSRIFFKQISEPKFRHEQIEEQTLIQ